jgi:hypothetical protein
LGQVKLRSNDLPDRVLVKPDHPDHTDGLLPGNYLRQEIADRRSAISAAAASFMLETSKMEDRLKFFCLLP